MPQPIDCWDLDGTILHTGRLFAPVIRRVAELTGLSEKTVADSLGKVSKITFTFQAWFDDLVIEESLWADLEAEFRDDIAARAPDCIYPGIRDILLARQQVARQVLITAGDPEYQRWKFELLGLDDIFATEDRHYIPLQGSKVEIIEEYLALGPVKFIDDRTNWLHEVLGAHVPVTCIRPRWPETKSAAPEAGDGVLWQTATTADELHHLLERGV